MGDILQPPSTNIPAVEDAQGRTMDFTPVWRKWFIDLVDILNTSGGTEGSVSSASGIAGESPIVVTGTLKKNNVKISVIQFTPTKAGVVPPSTGGTVKYLRADGQWAIPPSAPTNVDGGTP